MKILLPTKIAEWVRKEYQTEGHSPLQVVTEDQEIYVVKSSKGQNPPIAVLNELLCSFFLNCWRIPTPDFALIRVGADLINIPLSNRNKPYYYDAWCFGSKFVKNATELSPLTMMEQAVSFGQIENPMALLWIGLFDIWVENDDRKPSNPNLLIFPSKKTGRLRVMAIDHAYTFLSMGYEHLDPHFGVSQSFNDSILYSELVKNTVGHLESLNANAMRQGFLDRIARCKRNFANFTKMIPVELGFDARLQSFVCRFLFDDARNELVFQDFLERMR